MSTNIKTPKKLIEVALPLDDINREASREKSIRHGHPSTMHLWWARRPLAAARAVVFAQMVNDPGFQQGGGFKFGVNKEKAAIEREKLFDIIRELVKWENSNNESLLNSARKAIEESWHETCELNKNHPEASELFNPSKIPAFHDPFAGGGAIPLEAQRLGLESFASDLNPVAVLINKAMIEVPPVFAGVKPVGPITSEDRQKKLSEEWHGATGLAEDVKRYGHWILNEAKQRVGPLYPKVKITEQIVKERTDLKQYLGQELTIIAWLWARTVKSSNPAYNHIHVPLVSNFLLFGKKGKEAYVEPIIKPDGFEFAVKVGSPPKEIKNGTKLGRGATFSCVMSGSPMTKEHIRKEFQEKRDSQKLMAIVAETPSGRIYLPPSADPAIANKVPEPQWKPNFPMNQDCKDLVSGRGYGISTWDELFTNRQLLTLSTLSDLVSEVRDLVKRDAINAGLHDDDLSLNEGGTGATAYADAVTLYLGLIVSKTTVFHNKFSRWRSGEGKSAPAFGRQAIPMVWDFSEVNPFAGAGGDFWGVVDGVLRVFQKLSPDCLGHVSQRDAQTQDISAQKVISTDPPYYDNIGYADLSDFFYVWLRKILRNNYPSLFGTIESPKTEELVATAFRHGGKVNAETFFMDGMTQAIHQIAEQAHPSFPVTIYYAFKQSETQDGNTSSAGWETFLEAVLQAGLSIVGTWPMRTENATRMIGMGTNALASSVVLVCQKRSTRTESISRRQFQKQLREEMPEALEAMIGGSEGASPIAPVDLAQAAIGPGMGIFSQYEAVLNQDGSKMSVHDALILINRAITDYLNPDTGNFDNDTLFCDGWFAEYGWSTGQFGQANTLAQAKGTTVDGVKDAGVIESGGGKVRLLRWKEYPTDWDPKQDNRTPVWEATHQLIRALNQHGESGAGELLSRMPERSESIRQLAYHLYTLCERKGWAEDARAYNELITGWHAIVAASHDTGHVGSQAELQI